MKLYSKQGLIKTVLKELVDKYVMLSTLLKEIQKIDDSIIDLKIMSYNPPYTKLKIWRGTKIVDGIYKIGDEEIIEL